MSPAVARGERAALAAFLVLPILFVAAALLLRRAGGAFWEWHIADPSYFYLFDALHIARFEPPGQSFHPGTPVQLLGALVLRLAHPLASGAEIAADVFADPEAHLRLIGNVLLGLNAFALLVAGLVARAATGNLALALFLQAAPFLSMVILKNAYHVKPESLLIAVALALAVLVLAAGRAWTREEDRRRLAVLFGVVTGLGVATKLTAAPLFLLPLFLVGGARAIALYAVSAVAAFALFTLPAWPNFAKVSEFTVNTLARSGAYGGGAGFVVDLATYPRDAIGVASRPVVFLQLVFGAAALLIAGWRRRRSLAVPAFESRALAGLALAILAQVLAVAKQPTANYMVPAYMLLPLAAILFYRFVAGLGWGHETVRRRTRTTVAVLLIALIAAQALAVRRQYVDLAGKRAEAAKVENGLFAACTRIYFFAASSPSFALFLGDWWTGSRQGTQVAGLVAADEYWFEQNTLDLRDAQGSRDLAQIVKDSRCVFLRGGNPGPFAEYLARHAPGIAFDRACSTRDETVLTWNVDCAGRVSPKNEKN
jgi:hypothetical protein